MSERISPPAERHRPECLAGLSSSQRHGVQLLRTAGDVTPATAEALRSALVRAARARPAEVTSVVLDLSEVGVFPAAAITALLAGLDAAAGALTLHLVATGTALRSVHLAGLPDHVMVHPGLTAALAAAGSDDTAALRREPAERERRVAGEPVIEQAKGMLIVNLGLDDDAAFDMLVGLSQDGNVKVRDVAAHVVATLTGTASVQAALVTLDQIEALRDQLRQHD